MKDTTRKILFDGVPYAEEEQDFAHQVVKQRCYGTGGLKMPTIEQVRRELAGLKILNSFHNIIAVVEQYLSSGGAVVEKRPVPDDSYPIEFKEYVRGYNQGIDNALDAVKLAGWARVPSIEQIVLILPDGLGELAKQQIAHSLRAMILGEGAKCQTA